MIAGTSRVNPVDRANSQDTELLLILISFYYHRAKCKGDTLDGWNEGQCETVSA